MEEQGEKKNWPIGDNGANQDKLLCGQVCATTRHWEGCRINKELHVPGLKARRRMCWAGDKEANLLG